MHLHESWPAPGVQGGNISIFLQMIFFTSTGSAVVLLGGWADLGQTQAELLLIQAIQGGGGGDFLLRFPCWHLLPDCTTGATDQINRLQSLQEKVKLTACQGGRSETPLIIFPNFHSCNIEKKTFGLMFSFFLTKQSSYTTWTLVQSLVGLISSLKSDLFQSIRDSWELFFQPSRSKNYNYTKEKNSFWFMLTFHVWPELK